MRHLVVGLDLDWVAATIRAASGATSPADSQLRWIGPDKGAIHLATGAVVNAVWDLWAKLRGKPLWQLVGRHEPGGARRGCIDFRYITDCITPDEALAILAQAPSRARPERIATLEREGYPCYTTSAGWLGYPRREADAALPRGGRRRASRHIKLKVGRDLDDDIRRLRIARAMIGARPAT